VGLEGLGKFKTSSDLIGNGTRDLPVCSIVPQSATLQRAPRDIHLAVNERCKHPNGQ
jgi:hypothetical protein